MNFNRSPGVYTQENDLTQIVTGVDASTGGIAGVFRWGPVGQRVLIDQEKTLVSRFGKPTNFNAETFFTAANFLAYSGALYVVRTANTSGNSTSIANTTTSALAGSSNTFSNTILVAATVSNEDDYTTSTFDSTVYFAAKYPGVIGNSLKISVCDSTTAFSSNVALIANVSLIDANSGINYITGSNSATINFISTANGTANTSGNAASVALASLQVGDLVLAGNSTIGTQTLKIATIGTAVTNGTNTAVVIGFTAPYTQIANVVATTVPRQWEYARQVSKAPTTSPWLATPGNGNTVAIDELHVVVTDEDGLFTGSPGTVLETFEGLSRATDAKNETGQSIYYKNWLNNNSQYVWYASDIAGAVSNTGIGVVNSTNVKPTAISFVAGQDGPSEANVALGVIASGYDTFVNSAEVDLSVIMQGKARGGVQGEALANYIISNVLEVRKDVVGTFSADSTATVNRPGLERDGLIAFRAALPSTSYAVMDSGHKYQYDKYNDVFRWIPLNGDIAGIIARTDTVAEAWTSPGGINRGQIKNVVKLAFNPKSGVGGERDVLYNAGINPVISVQGEGTYLNGDKTLLATNSAFNRIGVRRLFIVLRRSIANASKAFLFEFNDVFTRAQFVNMVTPYLNDVQGKRGITAFKVVCDETNNTDSIIDQEGFVGAIYVKPNRSINVISLEFNAVGSGVEFSEVINS